jgi:tetratricopeptide (TPR) repeat protein
MQDPRENPSRRLGPWWLLPALAAAVLGVYWPALAGRLLWDDEAHVTRSGLQSLAGLGRIWTDVHATQQYYPLLHSAFWLEHRLWGDATLGYHLLNVLLHATAAWLFILVLRRLAVPGSILAGLLFALHPVCVESVAWISEQKNTLSLVFYLLATLAYLGFDEDRGRPAGRRAYRLATLLFVLALLTKSVTATLPAALLVLAWWRRGTIGWRRDVVPLLPWFLLAAASGLFTSWVERTIGGAQGAAFDLTLGQRCLLAGRILWFYLGKLLWPTHLALIYPRWDVPAMGPAWAPGLAAALAVTAGLWVLRRRTRAPLAAWLLYVGTLFPALGFFNVYPFLFSYVADHFQYQATLGVFAALAAGATVLLRGAPQAAQATGWAVLACFLSGLALLSNADSEAFADPHALFAATLAENPSAWLAHDNLGLWDKDHGNVPQAMREFDAALRLHPDYPQAHNNLGLCYEAQGDFARATEEFRTAIRLKPDLAAAHNNLGSALSKTQDSLDGAIAEFREAVRLLPEFAAAHGNLGAALLRSPDHLGEAIAEFREAVLLEPNRPEAHASLGDALSDAPDRLAEAEEEYQASLRLDPRNAQVRNNLGLVLNALGRPEEAIAQYNEALRLAPGFAEIRLNLAITLLGMPGRRADAAHQLDAYLQVRPANDLTRQILAQLQGN